MFLIAVVLLSAGSSQVKCFTVLGDYCTTFLHEKHVIGHKVLLLETFVFVFLITIFRLGSNRSSLIVVGRTNSLAFIERLELDVCCLVDYLPSWTHILVDRTEGRHDLDDLVDLLELESLVRFVDFLFGFLLGLFVVFIAVRLDRVDHELVATERILFDGIGQSSDQIICWVNFRLLFMVTG